MHRTSLSANIELIGIMILDVTHDAPAVSEGRFLEACRLLLSESIVEQLTRSSPSQQYRHGEAE